MLFWSCWIFFHSMFKRNVIYANGSTHRITLCKVGIVSNLSSATSVYRAVTMWSKTSTSCRFSKRTIYIPILFDIDAKKFTDSFIVMPLICGQHICWETDRNLHGKTREIFSKPMKFLTLQTASLAISMASHWTFWSKNMFVASSKDEQQLHLLGEVFEGGRTTNCPVALTIIPQYNAMWSLWSCIRSIVTLCFTGGLPVFSIGYVTKNCIDINGQQTFW